HHGRTLEWSFSLHTRGGAFLVVRPSAGAGPFCHRPNRVPQSISLCAQPVAAQRLASACAHGTCEGSRQRTCFPLARSANRRFPTARAGCRLREPGICRCDSSRSAMRLARHRSIGLEGRSRTRPLPADQSDQDRHRDHTPGEFSLRSLGPRLQGGSCMRLARTLAIVLMLIVAAGCLLAGYIAPSGYAHQFREMPDGSPSHQHWLGTDSLGRDRFSRVLYGTRVSLLLAPAAALIATFLAALIGGSAGFLGGWTERIVMMATDLFLS